VTKKKKKDDGYYQYQYDFRNSKTGATTQPPMFPPVLLRHPLAERFHQLVKQIAELHDKKQEDYGRDKDPFANVRSASEWGVDPWVGAMVRLNDKVRRLQTLRRKGHLVNEGALDSFQDIAVYALIAYVLYEEQHVGDVQEGAQEAVLGQYNDYANVSQVALTASGEEIDDVEVPPEGNLRVRTDRPERRGAVRKKHPRRKSSRG